MPSTQCVCKECNITMAVDLNFRGSGVEFSGCTTTVDCPKCGNKLTIPDGKYSSNLYGNYIGELSQAYEASLSNIRTHHNFEHGDEFEVAICETLRLILPSNYGVCRGYVVDSAGNRAGDDIIIYDRVRFPTIRLEQTERYDRLQQIPIEAVYVYIEAKNTLHLDSDDGQSLEKSVNQVSNVKELVDKRLPVQIGEVAQNFPKIRNPMMGIILANKVRAKKSTKYLEDKDIVKSLSNNKIFNGKYRPDIIVAGSSVIALPFFKTQSESFEMRLPFSQEGTTLIPHVAQDAAFGTMVSSIFLAMEWVVLGGMPWQSIVADGLGMKSR